MEEEEAQVGELYATPRVAHSGRLIESAVASEIASSKAWRRLCVLAWGVVPDYPTTHLRSENNPRHNKRMATPPGIFAPWAKTPARQAQEHQPYTGRSRGGEIVIPGDLRRRVEPPNRSNSDPVERAGIGDDLPVTTSASAPASTSHSIARGEGNASSAPRKHTHSTFGARQRPITHRKFHDLAQNTRK
jgi:hypothetical protein